MIYDSQGRHVMQCHPSTWPQEVEQLRAEKQELALQVLAAEGQAEEAYKAQQQAEARVHELEAALREISTYASSGTAWEPDSCGMCENTLDTARAALQKREGFDL